LEMSLGSKGEHQVTFLYIVLRGIEASPRCRKEIRRHVTGRSSKGKNTLRERRSKTQNPKEPEETLRVTSVSLLFLGRVFCRRYL